MGGGRGGKGVGELSGGGEITTVMGVEMGKVLLCGVKKYQFDVCLPRGSV